MRSSRGSAMQLQVFVVAIKSDKQSNRHAVYEQGKRSLSSQQYEAYSCVLPELVQ
jgi:hypothetical protein